MLQLIIPAYNEEGRLPQTLRALRSFVLGPTELGHVVEVIVVDNNSVDATAAVARAEDCPAMRVRVIECRTPGKGAAVRAGFAASSAELVGFMDADGATDLTGLPEALRLLEAGADVVIGSRAVTGAVTMARHSRVRAWGARAYRRATRAIVADVLDTQCGFKLMEGDLGRTVMDATRSTGFSFDVELLGRAQSLGARIVEFPVTWTDVPGSTFVPARHGVAAFAELRRIRRRLRVEARGRVVARIPVQVPAQARTPILPAEPSAAALGVRA